MLAQKEVDIKNIKLEKEEQLKDITSKLNSNLNQKEIEC